MGWEDEIKNKIQHIKENRVEIINDFFTSENFWKSKYRKEWVTTLVISISGFENIFEKEDEQEIALILRTFHEGILSIMKKYGLKNIKMQGDSISGVSHTPRHKSEEFKNVFQCAMDINGYLDHFWKYSDYQIALEMSKELMISIGNGEQNDIVFAEAHLNKSKQLIQQTNQSNVILLGPNAIENNTIFFSEIRDGKDTYIDGETKEGIEYSTWHYGVWGNKI